MFYSACSQLMFRSSSAMRSLFILSVTFLCIHSATGHRLEDGRLLSDLVEDLLHENKYNSRVRPGMDTGAALDVSINMNVNDISSISEVKMEFSVTLYLRQVWRDQRLAYEGLSTRSVTLNHNQFDRMWTPDVFIRNLKAGIFHTITVPNRLIRLSPDGTILYSQRLTLTLACDMILNKYPMDNQTCKIEFGSYAYTREDIELKWRVNVTEVEVNPKISLPEYHLQNVSHHVCTKNFSSTGDFPCLRAHFHLERRLRAYVLSTYLPSLLVVLLSWVSFWIDLDAVPARISLGILTILTITTQGSGSNRSMPAVSFTKAIDVWMATCLVFVFGSFIEYSIVNVLARRVKHTSLMKARGQKCSCSTCIQAACGEDDHDIYGMTETDDNQYEDPNERMALSNGPSDDTNGGQPNCKKPMDTFRIAPEPGDPGWTKNMKHNKALMVDILSRVLFPVLFLIFNMIYWPLYLL